METFDYDNDVSWLNPNATANDLSDGITKRLSQCEAVLASMIGDDFNELSETVKTNIYWLLQGQLHETHTLFNLYQKKKGR